MLLPVLGLDEDVAEEAIALGCAVQLGRQVVVEQLVNERSNLQKQVQ